MRVAASISNDASPASPAVSRGRCAAPGPAPVWHDAQFAARIGATSFAKATVRTPPEVSDASDVVDGATVLVVAATVASVDVVAGAVVSVVFGDAGDAGDAVSAVDDSSDGCDEHAATTIAPPTTACRISRTGRDRRNIAPVWRVRR